MIQEKKGMLKVWNMILVLITFILCIFGTFLTRSGIMSSVHSFAVSDLGPAFLFFIVINTLTTQLFSNEVVVRIINREFIYVILCLVFLALSNLLIFQHHFFIIFISGHDNPLSLKI